MGSFASVSMPVNISSKLVSPLQPLVIIYNSWSLENLPTSYFLYALSTHLLSLYCIHLHMFIYCLRFLSFCRFPWSLVCTSRQPCLLELPFRSLKRTCLVHVAHHLYTSFAYCFLSRNNYLMSTKTSTQPFAPVPLTA